MPTDQELAHLIRQVAEPLPLFEDESFGAMFDRFADARVVLLGEASHGTSEFYRARAAITRRLIERHGFTIVAVEADWPDAATIDARVRDRPSPPIDGVAFSRFPTWMWRNTDVDAFVTWLEGWNARCAPDARTGFYGLDLYNLSGSIHAVLDYLDRTDPDSAREARNRYGCLRPWMNEPERYGALTTYKGMATCEPAAVAMLSDLYAKQLACLGDCEGLLDATANARLVANAERYYRAMFQGAADSWNLRDRHMFETLCALLEAKGPDAKAVVWAHNSHIGDASKTDMGWSRDELNIGQLCRQWLGAQAALIGFGTHGGTVACASEWDEPMEVKRVLPSRADSYERIAHDSGTERFLLDLRPGVHEALREHLAKPRLERFIGVIYQPDTERWSHYYECSLSEQFDAYVWLDETSAVTPLPTREHSGADDLWPSGL
jgi:erythromycin esterase-like protein